MTACLTRASMHKALVSWRIVAKFTRGVCGLSFPTLSLTRFHSLLCRLSQRDTFPKRRLALKITISSQASSVPLTGDQNN